MKILLIIPDGGINKIAFGAFSRSMREAPLTLTTLAALTPTDIELKIIDENVEKVPLDHRADIVGISALTGTCPRAYELADHFRKRGATVALGGVHVTLMPKEAEGHADVVFIGGAESTWPAFIKDFADGTHQARYEESGHADSTTNIPVPDRKAQRSFRYNLPNTVNATRGCMGKCDFCTVPALSQAYVKRPIDHVIREISAIKSRNIAFNDVSLVDDIEYAKELFTAMIPLKKQWGGLASVRVAKDNELVDLMRRSGCRFLLIGFESINQTALLETNKKFNRHDEYKKSIDLLHSNDISIQGCFIFGFDHDKKTVFESTIQRVNELKIDIPRYAILTPYPGTRLYERLETEGRIISRNWSEYDTRHVVFQPAEMSVSELFQGYRYAYERTFSIGSSIKRTLTSPHPVITLLGNTAYRIHNRQLSKRTSQIHISKDQSSLVLNSSTAIQSTPNPLTTGDI